jgi:hypothetical protein
MRRCFQVSAMSEAKILFAVLRQSADPGTVDAIEALVRDFPDRALCRINALDFAAKHACWSAVDEGEHVAFFDPPEDFEQLLEEITLDAIEIRPGEKAVLSLQLPAEFVIFMAAACSTVARP